MGTGAITSYIDVAQIVLYMFWIFFAGLVYYLVRENHREGYPMDADRGVIEGWPVPGPKTYLLPNGREVTVPSVDAPQTLNAQPINRLSGAPIEPVGNPLLAGVGPGSWVARADVPDLDLDGVPKIVPLRNLPEHRISPNDPDPRGMAVAGGDGEVAGTVVDVWLDTCEALIRYLEVEVKSNGRRILLPINFARITRRKPVQVHAIYAHHFADVPGTRLPEVVTILEEEKICAYFGAGLLYADAERAEPLL
jgi:photosynthetic reaction center H subunit